MRIERTGTIPRLTPRVELFLKSALRGIPLDDLQAPNERRVDYSCLGGLLAIELKTLEEGASGRIDNLLDELQDREDWPKFLGSAPIDSFLKHTNDPEGLRRRVAERIGRAAINHLKKANHQLEAHYANFPRRNVVGAILLVNEDHEIYDPTTISFILSHALRRYSGEKLLYRHVDLIIYMTERHATIVDGRIAFPTLLIEGQSVINAPWKGEVASYFARRWAEWNGAHFVESELGFEKFDAIDHVPDTAPRHERWRTEYRRNPYLRGLSFDQLRDKFDEVMVLNNLTFLVGSPLKPPHEITAINMQQFTHLMMEMGERAIQTKDFRFEPSRQVNAAKRMNLPESVIEWLAAMEKNRVA